jgi:hypothetical protein
MEEERDLLNYSALAEELADPFDIDAIPPVVDRNRLSPQEVAKLLSLSSLKKELRRTNNARPIEDTIDLSFIDQ